MDDPIKIIFKYKNNNRRIQFHQYIFIGSIPKSIMNILDKIQDKSLYQSLISISNDDFKKLVEYYGEKWYSKFFNTFHINYTIEQIKKNKKQESDIKKKLGQVWYDKHVKIFELMDTKILYSYSAMIKEELLTKKERKKQSKLVKEQDFDYTTIKKQSTNGGSIKTSLDKYGNVVYLLDKMAKYDYNAIEDIIDGGAESEDDTDIEIESESEDNNIDNFVEFDDDSERSPKEIIDDMNEDADENDNGKIEFDEGITQDDELPGEELELDEIEKLYQDTDANVDKNIKKTSELIQSALKDDKLFKKIKKKIIDFDTSKDNLMYDESLRNTYHKHYVTSQYIYKDDTIKTIKNKICASIKNNSKFEKDAFIAPSRQYLWSEYFFENKLDRVMIGQKWIKRTDILTIDVEPNSNIRMYEELRGNLKLLRDNIRRYGGKIRREDDDFNILYDYEGYYMNNEIFMIDIYNELGKDYKPDSESLKNLIDVYIRVYFPRIKIDDIPNIMKYLEGNIDVESTKTKSIHDTLSTELVIENEIMESVETVRSQDKNKKEYTSLFKENYVTQSVIHVNLKTENDQKIDLFRIFNEFVVNHKYPFIQYQTLDGQLIFKYNEKDIIEFSKTKENADVLAKWFENAPYGISFKVRIIEKGIEKFMAINLSDTGRVEYKTQWKEDDKATITDIQKTYEYVRELLYKLMKEKNKIKFKIPVDQEFKYAFINTIQQFELPNKFIINHNDLSEFSRFFYPYVALVIEPRKRLAKTKQETEKGKFGTYLRYKRVTKYENQAKIEQRVLYFMRNYDYTESALTNEIAKQFNITLERSAEEIERVKNKYPNIRKSRKHSKR
jgi:hypothetical protein